MWLGADAVLGAALPCLVLPASWLESRSCYFALVASLQAFQVSPAQPGPGPKKPCQVSPAQPGGDAKEPRQVSHVAGLRLGAGWFQPCHVLAVAAPYLDAQGHQGRAWGGFLLLLF